MSSDYTAYMRSAAWHRRKQLLRRVRDRCEACGYQGRLDVHHVDYGAGASRFAGTEPDEDLRLLCVPHHRLAEAYHRSRLFGDLRESTDTMIYDVRNDRVADIHGMRHGADAGVQVGPWLGLLLAAAVTDAMPEDGQPRWRDRGPIQLVTLMDGSIGIIGR